MQKAMYVLDECIGSKPYPSQTKPAQPTKLSGSKAIKLNRNPKTNRRRIALIKDGATMDTATRNSQWAKQNETGPTVQAKLRDVEI